MTSRVRTLRNAIKSTLLYWDKRPSVPAFLTALSALNPETATADEVQAVIGNRSWHPRCDECGQEVTATRSCGYPYDYESATADLCRDCLVKAIEDINSALGIPEPNEPCRHLSCEMVSGRKRDYLYCRDCDEALDGVGDK